MGFSSFVGAAGGVAEDLSDDSDGAATDAVDMVALFRNNDMG